MAWPDPFDPTFLAIYILYIYLQHAAVTVPILATLHSCTSSGRVTRAGTSNGYDVVSYDHHLRERSYHPSTTSCMAYPRNVSVRNAYVGNCLVALNLRLPAK